MRRGPMSIGTSTYAETSTGSAQAGTVATTFHDCWEFPKARRLGIVNYIYYSFSGGFRKYSSRDTAGPYSLFVSVSPSVFPSIVNPARMDSRMPMFPGAVQEKLWTRREPGKERPNVFHVRHILVSDRRWHKRARYNINNKGNGLQRVLLSSLTYYNMKSAEAWLTVIYWWEGLDIF